MHMYTDADAAHLIAPKGRSRIAEYYYFKINKGDIINIDHPKLIECKDLQRLAS